MELLSDRVNTLSRSAGRQSARLRVTRVAPLPSIFTLVAVGGMTRHSLRADYRPRREPGRGGCMWLTTTATEAQDADSGRFTTAHKKYRFVGGQAKNDIASSVSDIGRTCEMFISSKPDFSF